MGSTPLQTITDFPRDVRDLETVWIPMPDGCRLAARIWLPVDAEEDPVPAILEHLPYRRRDFTALGNSIMHPYYAGHGYACVRTDMRGSGDSDGILEGEYLQQELDDAVAVIQWLAAQPWCSGSVGMTGISWGGFNSLQVAALRPPALKAIVTACSTDDRYADDIHYMGGCLIADNLMWGSTFFSFNSRPPDPEVVGEGWREKWLERLENAVVFPEVWTRHQRRDEFWKHGSVCEDYADIECAVYAVGGWADGYSNAIPRLLEGLSCPRKGLIGPWSHSWPNTALPGPAIGFLQEALRWWDHWLKGEDSGIMDEPMLRVWMQEYVPPKPQYDERPGRWVAEPSWPSPGIEAREFALNAGRIDCEAGPENALVHESPQTVGVTAGDWCPYGHDAEMPTDQRFEDGASLVFDSEPLAERLEIMGAPVVALDLAADRPRAFVAVRLNDVAPNGAATRVTYGLLNLTHRNGHEDLEALEPGKRYRVRVQLNDIAHGFAAGHRIRVSLSTAYWPLAWPSPEPVRLTVYAGASGLVLPVRAPRAEDDALAPFGPAEGAAPLSHETLRPYHRARILRRDIASGETVIEAIKDRGLIALHDIGLTYSGRGSERYTIKDGDPLSARAENRYAISFERGDWSLRTESETIVSATGDDFLVTAALDAFEGDTRVFTRTWSAKVPRDLA